MEKPTNSYQVYLVLGTSVGQRKGSGKVCGKVCDKVYDKYDKKTPKCYLSEKQNGSI